jgi:SNF2 family DNA or RNA helicase
MLKAGLVDGICFDELSKLKNTDSKRYKALEKWVHRFDRRWGLTGTPAANGYINLFGQVKMLDLGKAFGPYVTYFRARYFTPVGDFKWEVTPGAEKVIHEHLKPVALRMDAEDYLKLPKLRPVSVYYEIPEKLMPHYLQLEDELYTLLEQGIEVAAVNNGVATNKCRQFASGALYRVPIDPVTGAPKQRKNDDYDVIHDEKLYVFEDLIEELQGQQTLVAYEFKHDLDRIAKHYAKRKDMLVDGQLPVLGGSTSADRGAMLEDMWNRGELPWLFGQPQSMAYGLNLQESDAYNIIFFTLTWDFELYDQLIRRLLRQGNKATHINVYHLLGRNTVDERVARTIVKKDKVQSQLLDALKDRRQYATDYDAQGNELRNKQLAASKQAKKAKAANDAKRKRLA